jgi:hypothetical protein
MENSLTKITVDNKGFILNPEIIKEGIYKVVNTDKFIEVSMRVGCSNRLGIFNCKEGEIPKRVQGEVLLNFKDPEKYLIDDYGKMKQVVKIISNVFDNKIIITGTYALSMQMNISEKDIHDIDILVVNDAYSLKKIEALKVLFPFPKTSYGKNTSFIFDINNMKVNITIKSDQEFEKIPTYQYCDDKNYIIQSAVSILNTKAEYARSKDFEFFKKYEDQIKSIIIEDIEKKFNLQFLR